MEGIGRTRRVETQPVASSRVVSVPCPRKPLLLQTPLGCPKNDPRDCQQPEPGSGLQSELEDLEGLFQLCPPSTRSSGGAEGTCGGRTPAQVSLPRSGEDAGCVHRHSSLNLGLQGSLEEPRPDVRFQGHVLAPPSHMLRAQRVQLTLLPALLWDTCCFGRTRLVSSNLLNVLNSYSC